MIKNVSAFQDSAGKVHTSRLQALVSEKKIETRAVLVKAFETKGMKMNGTIPSEDIVTICSECGPDLANVSRRFNKMIQNERAKGSEGQ